MGYMVFLSQYGNTKMGSFCSFACFREYVVGVNIHKLFSLSSLSTLSEVTVGKCGYARYSKTSVRSIGNSGGTTEIFSS